MGLWDNLKAKVVEMNAGLKAQVSRYKNADFAEGSMAMCALIASADGTIDAAERRKTAGFIGSNDALSTFNASDMKARFDHYCGKLEEDYDFGKIEAIQAISKLKKTSDQARAVIQLGIIIGGADGHFDDNEKQVVREVCRAVGIGPAEFDL